MGKLVVLLMMVGLIWGGSRIYEEGADTAFGGAFSFLTLGDDMPEKASAYVSTPRRVGAKVEASIQQGAARYEKIARD